MPSLGAKIVAGLTGIALVAEPKLHGADPVPASDAPRGSLIEDRTYLERLTSVEGLALPQRPSGPGWWLGGLELRSDPLLGQPFRNLSLEGDSILFRRFAGGSFQLTGAREFELEPDSRGRQRHASLLLDVKGDGNGSLLDSGRIYLRGPSGHFHLLLERGAPTAFDARYGLFYLTGTSDNWLMRLEGGQSSAAFGVNGKKISFEGRYNSDQLDLGLRLCSTTGFGVEAAARLQNGGELGLSFQGYRTTVDGIQAALSYKQDEFRFELGATFKSRRVDELSVLVSGSW